MGNVEWAECLRQQFGCCFFEACIDSNVYKSDAYFRPMRSWIAFLLMLQLAYATNRVVITFETPEQATRSYNIVNATVVKQYGRRMVLDLGREVRLPEPWLYRIFGDNITVELDDLVQVRQAKLLELHRIMALPKALPQKIDQ